jgi:adenine-specific DNA-methyltransferase
MRMIKALTKPGDLIVDPFVGVGSTAAAAVLTSRKVAGADLVGAYVRIARQRVKQAANGLLRYRTPGKSVYAPRPNTTLTTPPAHFRQTNGSHYAGSISNGLIKSAL